MAPRIKFSKEEIVAAALELARRNGIEAVTAREVGYRLGVSTRPIFTWFDSMEQLKADVYDAAKKVYKQYVEEGLSQPIPFLGAGQQWIRFAMEEPELYKLLFLTKAGESFGGAIEAMNFSRELVRESIMKAYNMDSKAADKFFRNMWFASFSFTTLIVTDNCPYTKEEVVQIMTEMSLSFCMGLKKIKGLADGTFDRDAVFRELEKMQVPNSL